MLVQENFVSNNTEMTEIKKAPFEFDSMIRQETKSMRIVDSKRSQYYKIKIN